MRRDQLRHLIVANQVYANQSLLPESQILGVISLPNVMNTIQKDERLSLQSLARKYPSWGTLDQYRKQFQEDANVAALQQNPKRDILTFVTGALLTTIFISFAAELPFLQQYANTIMIAIFVLGYIGILLEEVLECNKAGPC